MIKLQKMHAFIPLKNINFAAKFLSMSDVNRKWFYLVVLSIIWGTSYILIKKGLEGFTPIQLGSVRIVITSIFLFLVGYKSIGESPGKSGFG